MLVAQALAEPMRLMTHDAQVARYSDTVIAIRKSEGRRLLHAEAAFRPDAGSGPACRSRLAVEQGPDAVTVQPARH
jgi:hypothetical protein